MRLRIPNALRRLWVRLRPKRRRRRRRSSTSRSFLFRNWKVVAYIVGTFAFLFVGYVGYLDTVIRYEFEGKRWALPAHVFARPLELFPGLPLNASDLEEELRLLKYREEPSGRPGTFTRNQNDYRIVSRSFEFSDGAEPSTAFRMKLVSGIVDHVKDRDGERDLPLVRLDPLDYASIFPRHNEDRVLLRREDLPELLVKTLVTVEDRHFFSHTGVDFRALVRATFANIRAGQVVQGGSTVTQQLIKNFFLSQERSVRRKLKEALMAILIELHYSKDEILAAYANEIFLGQDGRRSIHGFGLAAHHYFGSPLAELQSHEMALLVGLIKGPSYYDPRRYPERATQRRNVVLSLLAELGVISKERSELDKKKPLDVIPLASAQSHFPAFVDLLRRQLYRDYDEDDLQSEGLKIFTTLDPIIQTRSEQALAKHLDKLDPPGVDQSMALQGAVVVTHPGTGDVYAVVGDRQPRSGGFNRAVSADRHIGSIVKPAVYLAALEQGQHTLASILDDSPLRFEAQPNDFWEPQNYDNIFHGSIPLYESLSQSYNVSTVRIGLEVGVNSVRRVIQELGVEKPLNPFPSLLLGATEMTPHEVAQMYQTLAARGFYTPLRTIRSVIGPNGKTLQRYSLEVTQRLSATAAFLVQAALHEATRTGTARILQNLLPPDLVVAGKTGTSSDLRDSWFAGFGSDRLAVVWVGRDDNGVTGLTGASGALPIWSDVMLHSRPQSLDLDPPDGVQWRWVVRSGDSVLLASEKCANGLRLPFVEGTEPREAALCAGAIHLPPIEKTFEWFKGLININ
jgi:penicillin-binding protein 1B